MVLDLIVRIGVPPTQRDLLLCVEHETTFCLLYLFGYIRPNHRHYTPIIEAYSLLETYDAERNRLQRECYSIGYLIR